MPIDEEIEVETVDMDNPSGVFPRNKRWLFGIFNVRMASHMTIVMSHIGQTVVTQQRIAKCVILSCTALCFNEDVFF